MGRSIPPPSRKLQIVALVVYTIALAVYLCYTASDEVVYREEIDNNLVHVPVERKSFNNIEEPHLVIEEVTFIKVKHFL